MNWKYCVNRNVDAYRANLVMVMVADAAEKRVFLKNWTSSIGCGVFVSHHANAPSTNTASAKPMSTPGSVQLPLGAWMMAYRRPTSPTIDSTAPIGSSGCLASLVSGGMTSAVRTKPAAHTGALIQNTECQPKCSTRKPPSNGPAAMPTPDTPAQMPIARLRSRGLGKMLVRIDSVVGKLNAPPMP